MKVISYKEYINNATGFDKSANMVAHREYYAQFVTTKTRTMVEWNIGLERILKSNDPHFNDINLTDWAWLEPIIKNTIDRKAKSLSDGYNDNGKTILWSLSTAICIAKEAAQQIKESNNKNKNHN